MTSDNSMSLTTATAGIYTDFDGLARLRGEAAEQTPEAKKEVAQQFEGIIVVDEADVGLPRELDKPVAEDGDALAEIV